MSIEPKRCPVCGIATNYVNRLSEKEGEFTDWYNCNCGIMFQSDPKITPEVYDKAYLSDYEQEDTKSNFIHSARTYSPVIEELTYGRQMLDVGFGSLTHLEYMQSRGWISFGIDISEEIKPERNIYKGDFLTYDFSFNRMKEEIEKQTGVEVKDRKFDLIWFGHVLEKISNPILALHKAYDLLEDTGCVFISTPDIEYIFKTGVAQFPYWKGKENYLLFSQRALVRELERIGFKVVLKRQNASMRFGHMFDCHIIAQKIIM